MAALTEERQSVEERVSRIEGAQAHFATKADVAQSETRITRQLAEIRAEIAKSEARVIRWMLAIGGFGIAAITVINRLLG